MLHPNFDPEMNTPWGHITSYKPVSDGIIAVNTGEHGGLWLSPERTKQLPQSYKPYTKSLTWAEEDVDAQKIMDFFNLTDPLTEWIRMEKPMNFQKTELTVRSVSKPSFTKVVSGYTVEYKSDWDTPVEIATYKSDSGWIAVDQRSGFQVNVNACKTRKQVIETTIATLNEVGEQPFWKRFVSFLSAVAEEQLKTA